MVEIVVSIVAKAAEYLVAPISRQFSYMCNYNKNYEKLREEVKNLMDARERVEHSVNDAKRKGEEIEQDVEQWLISVNKMIDVIRMLIEDEEEAKSQCFNGLCPNLKIRYQLSKKAAREAKAIVELIEKGKFDEVYYHTISEEIWLTSTKGYEVFESRMSTLKDILIALSKLNVNMIGVYGMGGIGKTMLVKEAARQVKKDKLFDEVVFADVSPIPDIRKIQGEIADELGLVLCEENESGRARKLYARLKKEKKILVILDNIWERLDLEMVGIPSGDEHKGCKVLLTSRSRDVLSREMDSENNFFVGTLNGEEAWSLFQRMAGDCTRNCDLQSLAVDIAKECAGLPISIVTIARALREGNLFEWKNALLELRRPSSRNFLGMQAVAYSTIELSYNFLKVEELKSTFLLCSLMGYTYNASILDLLKYGIGMGLFKGVNTIEEARDRVNTLVHRLKTFSLLLDSYTSEMFAMHDVVRDVAISIASRDQHVFTVRNEVVSQEWLDKDKLKICTAISLHKNDIHEFPEELECPHLRFFYMYPKDPVMKIPDNFFVGMIELRVLDLTKMHLLSLPSSLHLLVNLQTLCLDQCILGDLSVIGDLKNLKILSFFSSDIEQLPREVGQLSRLRLLDLSNCSKLKVIPPNVISSLSQLEELYMGNSFVQWEVEGLNVERHNANLEELKHLSNLTSLEIHIQNAKILPRHLFSKNLLRYKIFIGDKWEWYGKYETSRTLKLKLNTRICLENGTIMQLKRIEDLYLGELLDVKNVLYVLDREGFPQLKHLRIQNNLHILCIVDSMKCVACDAFPVLESLFLHNLINLEKICHGQLTVESFCNLRIIKVGNCNKLKSIFSVSVARGLRQLQIIEVTDCKSMEGIFATEREDIDMNEVFLDDKPCTPQLMISEELSRRLETHSISSCKITLDGELDASKSFSSKMVPRGRDCTMMTEMVVNEGDAKDVIVFNKLKNLSLSCLPSLTSFCSANYTFKFPSLEAVTVRGCPNMKIFCRGVVSTPRLWKVQLTEEDDEGCWEGDINTTIQEFHKNCTLHLYLLKWITPEILEVRDE